MDIQKFARKPFEIDAVQVTEQNIEEVAKWCDGVIEKEDDKSFIKVKVENAMNRRQTQAFDGDWVLGNRRGFKVYTDRAFRSNFIEAMAEGNETQHFGSHEDIRERHRVEFPQDSPPVPAYIPEVPDSPEKLNVFAEGDEPQELRTPEVSEKDSITGKR